MKSCSKGEGSVGFFQWILFLWFLNGLEQISSKIKHTSIKVTFITDYNLLVPLNKP